MAEFRLMQMGRRDTSRKKSEQSVYSREKVKKMLHWLPRFHFHSQTPKFEKNSHHSHFLNFPPTQLPPRSKEGSSARVFLRMFLIAFAFSIHTSTVHTKPALPLLNTTTLTRTEELRVKETISQQLNLIIITTIAEYKEKCQRRK
jgi:hypothetical protein